MTVSTPGYILEISDHALLVNGHEMPFSGPVETAIDLILEQLSQLTLSGSAPSGLGVLLKDNRTGGLGEVTRTIPSGSPVTLDAFSPIPLLDLAVPPAPVEASIPAVAPTPESQSTPAPVTNPVPTNVAPQATEVFAAPASATGPAPVVRAEQAPTLSPFARLAQPASTPPAYVATSPLEGSVSSQPPAVPYAAREELAPRVQAAPQGSDPTTVPAPADTKPQIGSPAVRATAAPGELSPASPENSTASEIKGLEPAADEIDYKSIFKEDEPIIDEGIRTPIGKSLTARQRTEGFSLKSNARREIERRRERKRKIIFTTVAAITLVAALRIVGAVMAGPSGDYAAICVDARTTLRLTNATCTTSANPFSQTLYLAVGDRVPAVGGKTSGGTTQKPADPRSINSQVTEGKDGVVLDGGEVK